MSSRKTSGLAITSLVLGIFGVTCLGLLTGLGAIICGHVARGKIRRAPHALKGSGLALAGLILGYLSIVWTILFIALALPVMSVAREHGEAAVQLVQARQIAIAINTMAADRPKDNTLGYPADLGLTSSAEVRDLLVKRDYLTASEAEQLQFENFLIGNVSDSDSPAITLIRSNPARTPRLEVIVQKDGLGRITLPNQPVISSDPPRTPPYLVPLP